MAEQSTPSGERHSSWEDLARAAYESPRDDAEAGECNALLDAVLALGRSRAPVGLAKSHEVAEVLAAEECGFDRYEVAGQIAKGGMGIIYRARDPRLGCDVALKVLNPRHATNPAMVQRFVEEAQIGGQLQHPGTVPVLEIGRCADRRPYFAMKLVKGRTLSALLNERKDSGTDARPLGAVFEKICQTMAYAHSRAVVHRDLKPSNVMVGAFGEVQVMDWGLAKVLGETGAGDEPRHGSDAAPKTVVQTVRSSSTSTHSLAGSVMGTPAYMPPEQARGDVDDVDERADVFALGAMLLETITGQPPYTGETSSEVRQKAQAGNLTEALTRLDAADVDPALDRLIRSCLSQERVDRPRDAGQVAAEFTAYLAAGEERAQAARLEAARAAMRAAAERRVRRRTVVAATALVLSVVIIAAGSAWIEHDRRGRQRTADQNLITALTETVAAREQAAATGPEDPAAWAGVRILAGRALALAQDTDADPSLRDRASRLHDRVQRDAGAAAGAAERRDADRAMITRLDTIRTRLGDDYQFDARRRTADYADAFRAYGIDVEAIGQAGATELIQASHLTDELVTALDLWAFDRNRVDAGDEIRAKLLAISNAVDTDPLRRALRRAFAARDARALRSLARNPRVEHLSVGDVARLGNNLGRAGDREAAIDVLEAAAARYPGDFLVRYYLATWLMLQAYGRAGEALTHATVALAIRPDSVGAWSLVGTAHKQLKQPQRASTAFERALEIRPESRFARNNLAYMLAACGDMDRALALHREAVEQHPNDGASHFYLGLSHEAQGDRGAAETAYRAAVRAEASHAEAWCNLGGVLYKTGKTRGAVVALNKSIEADPHLPQARVNLSECLRKLGRSEQALAASEVAIQLDRTLAHAHDARGCALRALGRHDEAVAACRSAVRLEPRTARVLNNLGSAHAANGELDEGLASFDEAIRLEPKVALYHENRGNILARKHDWPAAIAAFRDACALAPDDPRPLIKVGRALVQTARFEEALEVFSEAEDRAKRESPAAEEAERRIQACEHRLGLLRKAGAVLAGKAELPSADETLSLAHLTLFCRRHLDAARLFDAAFAANPQRRRGRDLVEAARAAARAAVDPDSNGEPPDETTRSHWMHRAATWLDLHRKGLAEILARDRAKYLQQVRSTLRVVLEHEDLAALRDPIHLAAVPRATRETCIGAWARLQRFHAEVDQ